MRIIYIADQIHLFGGAEKILIQKLNYWTQWYGYEVLLITTSQNGKPPFLPVDEKVKHVDLGIELNGGSYFSPKNITGFPSHCKKLKNAIDNFKPDAIFLISLGFVRYILPFIAGKYPLYNEYHTSYYGLHLGYSKLPLLQKLKKQILYKVIAFVESFYTKIVFLNPEELKHYKRKNGIIIPNFFVGTDKLNKVAKKKQVITLGRLSYQKGYDLLIDAWEIVTSSSPDWALEIYGNGEDHLKLQQLIQKKNLGGVIHLNPATDKVNEKLSESSIYVLSSLVETFPMVLLEALSNGLPVVAFNCPTGARYIITENEDGILAKPGDIDDLAKKILMLINDEELRAAMSVKAKINANRFRPEAVMHLWDQMIKEHAS